MSSCWLNMTNFRMSPSAPSSAKCLEKVSARGRAELEFLKTSGHDAAVEMRNGRLWACLIMVGFSFSGRSTCLNPCIIFRCWENILQSNGHRNRLSCWGQREFKPVPVELWFMMPWRIWLNLGQGMLSEAFSRRLFFALSQMRPGCWSGVQPGSLAD